MVISKERGHIEEVHTEKEIGLMERERLEKERYGYELPGHEAKLMSCEVEPLQYAVYAGFIFFVFIFGLVVFLSSFVAIYQSIKYLYT